MTLETIYWAILLDNHVVYIDGMPMIAPTKEHAEIILEEITELGYSEDNMRIGPMKLIEVSEEDAKIAESSIMVDPPRKTRKDLN